MAAKERPECLVCRTAVNPKDRRKIRSPSTEHVIPILSEFIGELNPPSTNTILHDGAFLCRPCLRSLEKLRKLRQEVKFKETELRQQMDKVGHVYGLRRESPTEPQHRTPEKRRAVEAGLDSSIPSPKRRRYDTPVRRALHQMVPTGSSPAVAVSTYSHIIGLQAVRLW